MTVRERVRRCRAKKKGQHVERVRKGKPLTSAEKKKRQRAKKMKNNPTYYQSELKRVEDLRKKKVKNMTPIQLKAYQKAVAVRKQKSRKNIKKKLTGNRGNGGKNHDDNVGYKSPQGYGKAVKKTMKVLPKSVNKQKQVVSGLAKKVGLQVVDEKGGTEGNSCTEVETAVKEFLTSADISYTAPGMKDEVTVWVNGVKERMRRYYLTLYLREAHVLFLERFPHTDICFSSFASYRPPNVFLLKDTPVDQCKCMIHENFRLRLHGLGIKYEYASWWGDMLCDSKDLGGKCWKGECEMCGVESLKHMFCNTDKAKRVNWLIWDKPQNDGGRIRKSMKWGCRGELEDQIMESMPEVQEHVRVKHIQSRSFETSKHAKTVIQMDFAMAYSCEYQNEIQSALWSRASVTLYTCAIFQNGNCTSYLIVSDTTDKGKNTVYTFVRYLVGEVISNSAASTSNSVVPEIVFFTDGPSSEFKNRYIIKTLNLLATDYGTPFEWQYFATSHGKGVVDGIGGRAKSMVRRAVMSGRQDAPVVQSARDFATLASTLLPKTNVTLITQHEIEATIMGSKPWDRVVACPGIRDTHKVVATPDGIVKMWLTEGEADAALQVKY